MTSKHTQRKRHCQTSATYNPINCSPEEFHAKFCEEYDRWKEFGFLDLRKSDPRPNMGNIIRVCYNGGGREREWAKVTISPYSERRIFSREKTLDIGSVFVAGSNSDKIILEQFKELTGEELRKVSGD